MTICWYVNFGIFVKMLWELILYLQWHFIKANFIFAMALHWQNFIFAMAVLNLFQLCIFQSYFILHFRNCWGLFFHFYGGVYFMYCGKLRGIVIVFCASPVKGGWSTNFQEGYPLIDSLAKRVGLFKRISSSYLKVPILGLWGSVPLGLTPQHGSTPSRSS